MLTKQKILDEMKRTAKENGGVPLGYIRFEQNTGIGPYDWGKYWIRFSDILKDAGFTPNRKALEVIYSTNDLLEKIIIVMRKLKKFPIYAELRLEKTQNPKFPYRAITKRLFPRKKLAQTLMEYAKTQRGYEDIVEMAKPILNETEEEPSLDSNATEHFGEVYLFKSGNYYKIGRTNDTVRRGNELKIQLPEIPNLIHSIRTDDPSGIESYWHERFEAKRKNGEWFDLNSADIKAFKRWKRIV
jgi:hypothetical protein